MSHHVSLLDQELTLPCGAVLKNRLVKSAMSDSLGDGAGNSSAAQARLYERWAQGGVGLSIIGEVQLSPYFAEKPGNLVLRDHHDTVALRDLTTRATINGAHIWPQLGHAGALAHQPISRAKGPSALDLSGLNCAQMTLTEIEQLPTAYANAAKCAKDVGFSGVQIHAGHGFLLSQFLSPLFNHRSDTYGGSIEGRARIIIAIIARVRSVVGPLFPIGIKINSSDMLEGGLTQEEALKVIQLLDQTSIDLIEISGGTYFPGAKSSADSSTGGAYFVDFSHQAKQATTIPLVVTGGFKTQTQALDALTTGSTDMIGLARVMVINPALASQWLKNSAADPVFPKFDSPPPGGITAWYSMMLTALGNDDEENFELDLHAAIRLYDDRDAERCISWHKAFANLLDD